MDYLDRNKIIRQNVLLWLGYLLIAAAIVIATLILVYQAYGFGINNKGKVIQNGLIFFSSQPNPANIYLNNVLRPEITNTRVIINSGIYKAKLTRSGYKDWTRTIIINGGTVEHFDYPFLIPNILKPQRLSTYISAPSLVTQSPDHRWILINKPGSLLEYDQYDLKNPAKPIISSFILPNNILTKAIANDSIKVVDWADDNQHVLLEHSFDSKKEYILLNQTNPAQTLNLNTTLNIAPDSLTLVDKKYDNYFIYQNIGGILRQINLSNTANTLIADHVLAYKTYSNNSYLYVTDIGASANKVLLKLKVGSNTYNLRSLPISSNYLLNLTKYSGSLYVAAGSSSDSRVYIFVDPIGQIINYPNQFPIPIWVLHVSNPNYLSFSDNAQFIVAENASNFSVYDNENNTGYNYKKSSLPLDVPQPHVSWMDGDRMTYVSKSVLNISDYDNTNQRNLINFMPNYIPSFSANYKYLYDISSDTNGQYNFMQLPLAIPTDL